MMAKELLTAIQDAVRSSEHAAYQIESIAGAMGRLGMATLANELYGIAERIVIAPRQARDAYDIDQTEQLQNSQAMMGSLLKATLRGCIVPPKPEPQP